MIAKRALSGGRAACVFPLLGGRARLGVGPEGEPWFEDVW